MADTKSESDVWMMGFDEFVAHLRSKNPKTVTEDLQAADWLEVYRNALRDLVAAIDQNDPIVIERRRDDAEDLLVETKGGK